MKVRTIFQELFSLSLLLSLTFSSSQLLPDSGNSSSALDATLQNYAFKAFYKPRTGVPYDAKLPKNLTGVKVSALRLRSGSLRTRGVQSYKEFQIPTGVIELPYVERLVLVYQNLGNWSDIFYHLPSYTYLTPVLGLLAYSGANLSGSDLPELDIRASDKPILIKFSNVKSAPYGSVAKCVYFDLHGSVQFDYLLPGNVCSTFQQGHFSIVVESIALSPEPAPSPQPIAALVKEVGGHKKSKVWKIVVSVIGVCIFLIILSLLAARVRRINKSMRIQQLEWAADSNEALDMRSIGGTKAPLAMGTRTRPALENDYIP
ncbi:hypothetical protein TanjilG_01470 [Lupinus angustifolius]|uniref:Legume lectin domain-containing protein n=1 Tax=Lupinus angustifolius TaxID=3871 RepID=A0A4P1QVK4_LUPAN|nr:PREDICTED: uncharacterized protein LOC109328935 [Lupinus angustifolius]OIV95676.1 hypothetical protein TanjilG_01470 [Lupinus angustifolius]